MRRQSATLLSTVYKRGALMTAPLYVFDGPSIQDCFVLLVHTAGMKLKRLSIDRGILLVHPLG